MTEIIKGDEFNNLEKELWDISSELFDEEIWNVRTKEDMKDLSKKEVAKTMFAFGFIMHQKMMDEEIRHMEKMIRNNPELAKDAFESLKKEAGDKKE